MSYPGEYVNPLPRTTFVQALVTSGYVTARLVAQDPVFVSAVGSPDANLHQITVQNTGATAFTFKMLQTNDVSSTGTRVDASSAIALVPGGEKTVSIQPFQRVLEIFGTVGTGNLRMSLVSKTRYNEMAFDRKDIFFPQIITQARPTPVAPFI